MKPTQNSSTLLQIILQTFHKDLVLPEDMLAELAFQLFEDGPLPEVANADVKETLGYFKQLIHDFQLPDLEVLQTYFIEEERRLEAFVEKTIDEIDEEVRCGMQAKEPAPVFISPFSTHTDDDDCNSELFVRHFRQSVVKQCFFLHSKKERKPLLYFSFLGVQDFCSNRKRYNKFGIDHLRPSSCGSYHALTTLYFQQFENYDLDCGLHVLLSDFQNCGVGTPKERWLSSEDGRDPKHPWGITKGIGSYYEQHLASRYHTIVDKLILEEPIEDNETKFGLSEWVLYSKLNQPTIRKSEGQMTTNAFWIDEVYEQINGVKNAYSFYEILRDFLFEMYERTLANKHWVILKCPPDTFWLTSDNAGFTIHLAELKTSQRTIQPDTCFSNISEDTVLYYPLTKDYCLRIEPRNERHKVETKPILFEETSEEEMNAVNHLTVCTMEHVVVASDKATLERYALDR